MNLVRVSAALATVGLLAGCGGTTVSGTSSSQPGSTSSGASNSSTPGSSEGTSRSTSESSSSQPDVGTSVPGGTLSASMHKALTAAKSVKFTIARVPVEGSTATSTSSSSDSGELQIADPMTGKYTDSGSAKRDLIVVGGEPYGYFKQANAWVKKSASPDELETRYLVNYTSQLAQNDPRVVADMVSAGTAVVKGKSLIAGASVTHYAVTASFSALIDKQVNSMKSHGCDVLSLPSNRTSLERSKAKNGSTQFTMDVYLDDQGRLIRFEDPVTASERGTRDQTTYRDYGASVDPKAPEGAKSFAEVRRQMGSTSSSSSASSSSAA